MCHITSAQITADGAAVGQALENLGTAIKPTDPSLAADLQTAGVTLIDATENWQEGTALTDVESAEQAAVAVLNAIPATSPYAPLVAIAFDALNLLIANSQTQSTQTGSTVADAHALLAKAQTLNSDSHWAGKAKIKHHFLNPPRKDFESAWNADAEPLGVGKVTL